MKTWKKQASLAAAILYLAAVLLAPAAASSCPACNCDLMTETAAHHCHCAEAARASSSASHLDSAETGGTTHGMNHCSCHLKPASDAPALPAQSDRLKTRLGGELILHPAAADSSLLFPSVPAAGPNLALTFLNLILSNLNTVILLN